MPLGFPLVPSSGSAEKLSVGLAKADNGVARQTARRTARRISRRQARYNNALPEGRVKVIVAGSSYFQCGTAFYQPVVHEGANVYVIVTP